MGRLLLAAGIGSRLIRIWIGNRELSTQDRVADEVRRMGEGEVSTERECVGDNDAGLMSEMADFNS
jgi:hypothetical protein